MIESKPLRVALAVAALCLLPRPGLAQSDAESHFQAGLSHLREGRARFALDEFKAAVKGESKNPYFRKGLGQAYARLGEWKEAIEQFEEALDLNPYFVDVRNDLGTALLLSGRRAEGKAELLKAYNDPTNPTPELTSRNLGQAYFEEGSYQEALNWYRTSLSRNRKYPDAYLGVADTLVKMDRLDEALLQLEGAVGVMPEVPSLLLALGEGYYRAGRYAEARQRLEDVTRKDPGGSYGLRAAELLSRFPK